MLASYLLSRTLVPTLAMYFFGREGNHGAHPATKKSGIFGWVGAFHRGFDRRFESMREGYRDFLSLFLRHAGLVGLGVLVVVVGSFLLVPWLGQDFFPAVDAGRFDLHVRTKSGTRIEETARTVDQIEGMIRQVIPKKQLQGIIDNIGIPYIGTSLESEERRVGKECRSRWSPYH